MTVAIRFARPDDAETIHALITELAVYEKEPNAVEASPDTFREQLAESPPPFECLIAERGGEPLGYAIFFHNYSTWRGKRGLYIEDIYVAERFRRQGVGLALLRHLASLAQERGCARMEWSVLDWNQPAIDFYESLGAIAMDTWTTFRMTETTITALAQD